MYNHECEIYKKNNPGISITKFSIAKLTAIPYVKAFSPENLSLAFKKAGIFSFNSSVITPEQVAPSIIYTKTVEQVQPVESDIESDSTINYSTITNNVQESSQQQSESCTPVEEISDNFFSARNITVVKQRPKRKFVPPFVAGSLHKKTNQGILSDLSIKAASKAVPEKKYQKLSKKTIQVQRSLQQW